MTTPSISGDDVTILEVEFGLGEIAVCGLELRLGLLDVRRFRRQPSEDAIDVAFFFERLNHLVRRLPERMDDAQLRRALDQVRLRLQHGSKGLIEIGRNLGEISPSGCGGSPKETRV